MNTHIRKKLIDQGRLQEQAGGAFGPLSKKPDWSSEQADGASFFSWFWEDVIGLSSESYKREFWRAANLGYTIGPVPKTLASWQRQRGVPLRARVGDLLLVLLVIGCPALMFYLVRKLIRQHISALRRPTYYERERDRRIELGKQRRAITARRTYNPKPSFEAIRVAWNGARHRPEGALCLGGLLEDLECYVNNHARGNAATGYRGRYGGIKRLLETEAPDLFAHYAALMRYKSIARRFRQACGVDDPIPADAIIPVLDDGGHKICSEEIKQSPDGTDSIGGQNQRKTIQSKVSKLRDSGAKIAGWRFPIRDFSVDEATYVAAVRILRACELTVISLEAALALEIDPDLALLTSMPSSNPSRRVVDWLRRRTHAA